MGTIRFLHTADLHLDSPFKGMAAAADELERLQQSTFAAFDRFISYAVKEQPDFIVITGDIYDGEDRSLRAQIRFQQGMQQLGEIPVYLSYGNHDHLAGSWTRVSLPANVHVFSEKVERKQLAVQGETVNLYGFSYPERHVREPMIAQYPKAADEGFHIGLLHGSAAGDSAHAVYAPFTAAELLEKNYQYWALGHIHKRQKLTVDPPIVYPGNLQGRHRNEQGVKGFYDVTLSYGTADLTFVPASDIVFTTLNVSCEGIQYADEWVAACEEAIDGLAAELGNIVVELTLEHTEGLAADLMRTPEAEWLDLLRGQYTDEDPFVWISSITWPPAKQNELPGTLMEPVEQTIDSWNQEEWQEMLKDVYSHRAGRYLEPLSEEALQQLKQQAADLLANELLKEG